METNSIATLCNDFFESHLQLRSKTKIVYDNNGSEIIHNHIIVFQVCLMAIRGMCVKSNIFDKEMYDRPESWWLEFQSFVERWIDRLAEHIDGWMFPGSCTHCQIVPFQSRKQWYIENISNTPSKLIPLYSPSFLPWNDSNLIFLAQLLTKLAYLCM